MASIRKRISARTGGVSWQVQVRRRGVTLSSTFATRREAEQWAYQTEAKFTLAPRATLTLAEALTRYLAEVTPQKRSRENDVFIARTIQRDALATTKLSDITSAHIAWFQQRLERRGLSGTRILKYLALLSHLFTVARRDWGYAALANPVSSARKPRPNPPRERRLKPEEEEALLSAAEAALRAFIILALETAARRTELCELRWEDVDFASRTATFPVTKSGRARTIPLSSRAIETLKNLPHEEEHIFPWRDPHSLTTAFRRLCKRARIDGLRVHDLRHEATSRLFERGLGIQEVATVTGHRTWQMLARYTHPDARRIAEKLD